MTNPQRTTTDELGLLLGGLIAISGLSIIAVFALSSRELSLVAGTVLIVTAVVGRRMGVPTLLAVATFAFGVVLLVTAASGVVA